MSFTISGETQTLKHLFSVMCDDAGLNPFEEFASYVEGAIEYGIDESNELELVTTYEDQELSRRKLYIGDSVCYEGELDRDGKRQGKGREYDIETSQLTFVGEFENDKRQGNGFAIGVNGDRTRCLFGTWKDGKRNAKTRL